jgi:erythromycin esterase-like protein
VSTASPGFEPVLNAVSARTRRDAWAVGDYFSGSSSVTLIEHWNGSVWSQVTSPNPGGSNANYLYGASAESGTDAWAVGSYSNGTQSLDLILHWNGSAWSQAAAPSPGSRINILYGVSADLSTDAWAAGGFATRGGFRNLLLRWSGTSWDAGENVGRKLEHPSFENNRFRQRMISALVRPSTVRRAT